MEDPACKEQKQSIDIDSSLQIVWLNCDHIYDLSASPPETALVVASRFHWTGQIFAAPDRLIIL